MKVFVPDTSYPGTSSEIVKTERFGMSLDFGRSIKSHRWDRFHLAFCIYHTSTWSASINTSIRIYVPPLIACVNVVLPALSSPMTKMVSSLAGVELPDDVEQRPPIAISLVQVVIMIKKVYATAIPV